MEYAYYFMHEMNTLTQNEDAQSPTVSQEIMDKIKKCLDTHEFEKHIKMREWLADPANKSEVDKLYATMGLENPMIYTA